MAVSHVYCIRFSQHAADAVMCCAQYPASARYTSFHANSRTKQLLAGFDSAPSVMFGCGSGHLSDGELACQCRLQGVKQPPQMA